MASKEQIQKALDELWTRYGNTLSMLNDSIDKIDSKDTEIAKLKQQLADGKDIDIDISTPQEILDLEKSVLNRDQ